MDLFLTFDDIKSQSDNRPSDTITLTENYYSIGNDLD